MIVAGDVGGTKTVLAVLEPGGTLVREQVFAGASYPSFEAILDEFLGGATPQAACFGVAGPVDGNTAKITNLPWTIDGARIAAKLKGAPVSLINDLQATALGHLEVPASAFAVLQDGEVLPHATIAVIAPGTGLGESLLVSDGHAHRALPSEGGHADFAPTTEDEIELLRYLRKLYGEHVSYERVLSGNGLGDLYDFVRTRAGADEPAWLTAAFAASDRNALVSKVALEGGDPSCARALEMFVDVLGSEAGNLALRGRATGGVSIGGGIPPKILAALQTPRFLDRFTSKGRFTGWARSLRVRVCLEPRAALFGAARYAREA
ncbi:MAG: glucokinase [Proteobacteria bacterium]|nr:glucokinase [Pseudomonadota bacterium]